jgi:hypothetical protein
MRIKWILWQIVVGTLLILAAVFFIKYLAPPLWHVIKGIVSLIGRLVGI